MTATADATDSSTVNQLTQAVKDLQATVEQQAKRINELEDELTSYRAYNERDKAEIRQKITDVENRAMEVPSEDATPGVNAGKEEDSQNAETLL